MCGTFLIPVPVLGTLAGGCIGAFLVATMAEHSGGKELRGALKAGSGAAAGQVIGLILKLCAGLCCWVVLAVAAFVP